MTNRNRNQHLLPDGRRMAVRTANPGAARVTLLCHPNPGAGGFDPSPTLTAGRGVTLISPDHAGYGHSEPRPETPGHALPPPRTTSHTYSTTTNSAGANGFTTSA